MPELYPELGTVAAGWNEWVPVIGPGINQFYLVQPQMYNTWAGVETIAYATQYAKELIQGWSPSGPSGQIPCKVPGSKLILGYPASPSGAGSGYIDPSAVASMAKTLVQNNQLAGIMTWDIGWDQKSGWKFANAMAQVKQSISTNE